MAVFRTVASRQNVFPWNELSLDDQPSFLYNPPASISCAVLSHDLK